MHRRDFLIGTAVGATALVVAPSALAAPPENFAAQAYPMRDFALYERQALIRSRALLAEEMYVCWGQRSGKFQTARAIYDDRLQALGTDPFLGEVGSQIVVVTGEPSQARDIAPLFCEGQIRCGDSTYLQQHPGRWGTLTHFLSVREFMDLIPAWKRNRVPVDSIFFEEADWMSVSPNELLQASRGLPVDRRGLAPLKFLSGSPSRRDSDFLTLVKSHLNCGGTSVVADHAATWEVNPNLSYEFLLRVRERDGWPDSWERDFAAYRPQPGERRG